jgi:two-component system, OmpR family, response regulator MprA
MRILLVEDDKDLQRLLKKALADAGYVVDQAYDGEEGHFLGDTEPYDAVILDLGLPKMDGVTVLEKWRRSGKAMPVLILTARDRWSDKVAGFDAGADDYLAKPFYTEELLARLRALLRRRTVDGDAAGQGTVLQFADLSLNQDTREVRRGERSISLTRTEFSLLELLLSYPRRVLTRAQILEQVWGYDFPTTGNALEVYIGYLRRKTEADGEPRLIHTVRGVGYVLRESPP